MTLSLNTLAPARGSKSKRIRIGRGNASGMGTYSTRGLKGQKARSGGRGGLKLMGLKRTIMKLPKFKGQKPVAAPAVVISVATINRLAEKHSVISKKTLRDARLIAMNVREIKVVGKGAFSKPVVLRGIAVSGPVLLALEAAGGKVSSTAAAMKEAKETKE